MARSNRRRKVRSGDYPSLKASIKRALLGDFLPEDLHLYRINRHTFIIYVGGETVAHTKETDGELTEPGVEYNMADRLELNLGLLSSIDPNRPILIVLASCGGNWEEGMQMFSAILNCPNPVTVLAVKWARSMTSLIPLAADRFVIRAPTKYMFHYGTYSFSGLVQEAETDFLEDAKAKQTMLNIYTARLREQGKFKQWSRERILRMLKTDIKERINVWLTSEEAKEWGFADQVLRANQKILLATEPNKKRRQLMDEAMQKPVTVTITVS